MLNNNYTLSEIQDLFCIVTDLLETLFFTKVYNHYNHNIRVINLGLLILSFYVLDGVYIDMIQYSSILILLSLYLS